MKKYQNFIMVLALILVATMLVGCNRDEDDTPENNNNNSSERYTRGTANNDRFESAFLNLRFNAPQGFVLLDDDEMEELMGMSMEYVLGEDGLADFAQSMIVYEMVATNLSSGNSAQIIVERLLSRNITMEAYIEASIEQFGTIFPDAEFTEPNTMEFAGETYTYFTVTSSMFGMEMSQKTLLRQIENRMVVVMFTIVDGNEQELEVMLNGFSSFN